MVGECLDALEHVLHLALPEQANLIYRLPSAALGGKKVLKARNILLRGEGIFSNPDEMDLIVETTVLRHLYAYYYRDTPEIVYWRDAASNREVDIIVRSPAYLLPFEIKYKEKPGLDRNGGLAICCRSEEPKLAFMVTKRDSDFSVSKLEDVPTRFLKIPAHILCYLSGQAERLPWTT